MFEISITARLAWERESNFMDNHTPDREQQKAKECSKLQCQFCTGISRGHSHEICAHSMYQGVSFWPDCAQRCGVVDITSVPAVLFQQLCAIKTQCLGSGHHIEEGDLIAVELDAALELYQKVLTAEQWMKGENLTVMDWSWWWTIITDQCRERRRVTKAMSLYWHFGGVC